MNSAAVMTGNTVLHYQVGEKLGAGGMGEVYRATDTRLGRHVAIKFLHSSTRDDSELRARLMREARAASSLSSPHIAAIYDIGEHAGSVFLVMELVEGEVLSKLLERGPLPVAEAVDIALQAADALDEAHAAGVVHRDIKSSNLIVSSRHRVKVLDFGLARFEDVSGMRLNDRTVTERFETVAGAILGTFSYMSPEQARGRQVDGRSDLFSLGVVLFEMLTGRLPFEGVTTLEVVERILTQQPPPITRFARNFPHELEHVVEKALEKDLNYRYQSARDMYLDLRNVARHLQNGDQLHRDSRTSEIESSHGSGTGPVADLAHQENVVAVMTFSNITGDKTDEWIGTGIAETVTADLKNVHGLTVVGRAQIFDVLKHLSSGELTRFDERLAVDVGRRLGATWIVGGGYQRMGEAIRITAHFLDVGTGSLAKTVKVDGRVTDIFDLQDKIVYELSQGLNLQLAESEIAEIERDETRSVEAYEAYSRGMMNFRMATPESMDRAIYLFEKAIEHDPKYASAWAALGAVYDLKGSFLGVQDLVRKGVDLLRHAIEINPKHSMGYSWLGSALNALGQYNEAIASLQEALKLDPENAGAHQTLGRVYWVGKGWIEEGIAELEKTVQMNREFGYAYLQLALLHTVLGNFERAAEACLQAIKLQEEYISGREGLLIVGAHTRLGHVRYRQGLYDDAIKEYERELAFLSTSNHALRERSIIELNQKLGAAYLRKGEEQRAAHFLDRAIKSFEERIAKGADEPFTKYYIAAAYALRGDADRACTYLEQTMPSLGAFNRQRLGTDPDFDAIRGHPRFVALLNS